MNKPVVKAETRHTRRKKATKSLKKEGYVPAIVYGHNIDNKNIKLKTSDMERIASRCEIGSSVELTIDDTNTMAIIKDVQRHIVKKNIIHVDFQELTKGEKVKVKIPIHVINKSSVENATSVVQDQLKEIEIQTLPMHLPQAISIDASLLADKDAIRVQDLDIYNDKNIEMLSDPESIIATLAYVSIQIEEETEEEESLTDL